MINILIIDKDSIIIKKDSLGMFLNEQIEVAIILTAPRKTKINILSIIMINTVMINIINDQHHFYH